MFTAFEAHDLFWCSYIFFFKKPLFSIRNIVRMVGFEEGGSVEACTKLFTAKVEHFCTWKIFILLRAKRGRRRNSHGEHENLLLHVYIYMRIIDNA